MNASRVMNKLLAIAFAVALPLSAHAELKLPGIISDHMMLQQKIMNRLWGWDLPGTQVTVNFAGQTKSSEAGSNGRWEVQLDPMFANATPQVLSVIGTTRREIQDVLVGEVWMCSGQSNMQFALGGDFKGDLEAAAANLPQLRLLRVPTVGSQDLQDDIFVPKNLQPDSVLGRWGASTPESAKSFSAVGFYFGRYLHQILGVPVGLIDNSWAGSRAEAWIRRDSLEKDSRFKPLMDSAAKKEAEMQSEEVKLSYETQFSKWKTDVETLKKIGLKPGQQYPRQPSSPNLWLLGNARPGNIFAGSVHPTLGYGIKGVIWYQGESNAGRAWEYRDLFPFMIEQWRKEWQQGDFSFYWVQLADFMAEKSEPSDSTWAELREAQTRALRLPNTGQAVIIDLGEGKEIHPKNKHDVAARLARWALVKDYGQTFSYRSPEFLSMALTGNRAIITFDMFGGKLRPFDVGQPRGFTICGDDQIWHNATGRILGDDRIALWSDKAPKPTAVRYAWADNPVGNLFNDRGLPMTPFRTDDFELITNPILPQESGQLKIEEPPQK